MNDEKETRPSLVIKSHEFKAARVISECYESDSALKLILSARGLLEFLKTKINIVPGCMELMFLMCLIHMQKIHTDDEFIHFGSWMGIADKTDIFRLEIQFCKMLWGFPDFDVSEFVK